MPPFVARFITDTIETGIAALFAITFVVPTNFDETKQVALLVGAALAGAVVSAARRAVPGFLEWLKGKLGTAA